MQLLGIRRIRSTSANSQRSINKAAACDSSDNNKISDINGGGNDCVGGSRVLGAPKAANVQQQQRRMFDGNDITSLDNHRRISALEAELRLLKETTFTAARDLYNREQEVHCLKHEHAKVRQHFENIINDLTEKQKDLLAELEQSRVERVAADHRADAALSHKTLRIRGQGEYEEEVFTAQLLNLRRELETSRGREAEAVNELAIVVEKLSKADAYIQTLSDEAVAYQMEIEKLWKQLSTKAGVAQNNEEEKEEEARNNLHFFERKGESVIDTGCKRTTFGEVWAGLAAAALQCADSCDDVSRECDGLIDVLKEEQQLFDQRRHNVGFASSGAGVGQEKIWMNNSSKTEVYWQQKRNKQHQQLVSFMSCKPTGAELDQLLRASCLQRGTQKENDEENDERVCAAAWEGTARIITQLLCGMNVALREAKGDVLIAARAYAELCRAGRDVAEEVAALRTVSGEERAAVVTLEERLVKMNESLCAERERANHLQASLDETADIMAEAASLAGERTSRMEKLLNDNAALEEAQRTLRKSLREREDVLAVTERELQKEQAQLHATREELHKATRAAAMSQKELDAARSHNEELERRIGTLKEESQKCEVDRLYLRKCVEELRGQVAHMQQEKKELREAKESAETEKRRLLLQIDRMRRGDNNCNSPAAAVSLAEERVADHLPPSLLLSSSSFTRKGDVELSSEKKKKETNTETESLFLGDVAVAPPRPAQSDGSMDKLRWWEEKLQAIASSLSPPALREENNGLKTFAVAEDVAKRHLAHSPTLESLAYGTPPHY